ncbi:LON peptidase substrate-binding domain-containing protein [Amycolatopsis sp. PS_44_ISF1]|uniref:LON peptidase substrate-binding domain-containing protein n=1 Tax=Amycolatopsis sp. PS_44_ISF1 TaxID=2974917 RepID=UPI0028DDE850|nr:LON peptidase substrate-binding domain-containing protein [Amycolatopsis sp. PS_44_ISF1]MDT8914374.1 LON peptidase substrate-binding domain-containing protein [Amycolatopsis sp. PS_44_ISF1]
MTEPEQTPSGTATLPLFPLQTVLLPGTHLPLHIFEPRYRQLIADLVSGGVPGREFGVVALRAPLVREVTGLDHVYDVGCGTVLREAKRLPDGRYDVVTKASRRFRLRAIDHTAAPYLIGEVEWLPDELTPAAATDPAARLAEVARAAHERYCEAAWHAEDWHAPEDDVEITELAYRLAADCLLPIEDRQLLLEETNPLRRLRIVCRLLTREAGFLSTLSAVPLPPTELADYTKPANLN